MKCMVIAPHPDDELLGVGGTILRRKSEGADVAWMIVTEISEGEGWPTEQVVRRSDEIQRAAQFFGFSEVFHLRFPAAKLDQVSMGSLVQGMSDVFRSYAPEEVFVPHRSDVHTDHRIVFDAATSCSKWFRYPSVRKFLAYETLSESDFGLAPTSAFHPNYFVDISDYLEQKIGATKIYKSEFDDFPFPRSCTAIESLARVRGAASGFRAAEAFELLRARE